MIWLAPMRSALVVADRRTPAGTRATMTLRDPTNFRVDVRDAFAPPLVAEVALMWTDPPIAESTTERVWDLRENWRPAMAVAGLEVILGLGDQSERSQEQIATDILRMTVPGELVVDPFCGTGTTGLVALAHGRKFYGCDTDPDMVRRARERLATGTDPDHVA
jgi:SAM-dependent methyltransferase